MELGLNPSPLPSNYGLIKMTSDGAFWHKRKMAALECRTLTYTRLKYQILGLPSTRPLHALTLLHVKNKLKFKKGGVPNYLLQL